MCIFSQPVVSVMDTNIFARLLPDGWQYLVYQMQFETQQTNAMVLPVPVQQPSRDSGSMEFISLKENEDFFKDLDKGFPLAVPPKRRGARSWDKAVDSDMSQLQVHEVGDFIASYVPTLADFSRLDEQFRVPQDSWDQIPQYSDYGFAVFQLKTLKGKPHPMAFKFKSRLIGPNQKSVFFPTVHIHDGEVHDLEEFDHALFLQAPEFDRLSGPYRQRRRLVTDKATGYVRSKWTADRFCDIDACQGIVDKDGLVHRLEMQGRMKNQDVLADLLAIEKNKQSSLLPQSSLFWIGGIAGIAGMKWFFDRRTLVSQAGQGKASRHDEVT